MARLEASAPPEATANERAKPIRRVVVALLPLAVVVVVGLFLYRGLSLDPRAIPSTLIDKPVPEFGLAAVQGRTLGLSSDNLRGEVTLVNVFASWCVACRAEHPLLMELQKQGIVVVHGLNYKDRPADAAEWLDRFGDPYTRTGADRNGRVGIDFGVYGVPETFIIGADGVIVEKIIGPISPRILEQKVLPLVRELGG